MAGDRRLLPKAFDSSRAGRCGKAADDRLRVAERDSRRVVVARVEDRLHRSGVHGGEVLREVVGHDNRHLATARVQRPLNAIVVALRLDDIEIDRGLKRLEKRLALLAALAVENAYGHVPDVETDAIAQQRHLHERHEEHDHEASRVTHNLD